MQSNAAGYPLSTGCSDDYAPKNSDRSWPGHAVRGFTSTSEALAHLAAGPAADLLVVDYKMPELNGLEFIQRAWDFQPKLRVVMITAHGSQELMGRAAETGVHGLVLKPFTAAELTKGVKTALGG